MVCTGTQRQRHRSDTGILTQTPKCRDTDEQDPRDRDLRVTRRVTQWYRGKMDPDVERRGIQRPDLE